MTTSVLIVEDEPSILELISYTCRTSGMEVRKAANVAEAKKNLEAAKPDIILLDWMRPIKVMNDKNDVPVLIPAHIQQKAVRIFHLQHIFFLCDIQKDDLSSAKIHSGPALHSKIPPHDSPKCSRYNSRTE